MTDTIPTHTAIDASGRHYVIATDGSCNPNPGTGGWGVVIQLKQGDEVLRKAAKADFERGTTNIRMEMVAVLNGLKALQDPLTPAMVLTDSQMIVNAMTKGWLKKWEAQQWWDDDKPRVNSDLWQLIAEAVQERPVSWVWAREHAGYALNTIADKLAGNAAKGRYRGAGRSVRERHPELFQ